jgi:tRNA/rRNA methyltransferase
LPFQPNPLLMLFCPLQNISFILVRPQYAGNIGSASRAMKNMGFHRLILVNPGQDPSSPEARMMATSAKDILERASIFPCLEEALAGFRWIAGTSARKGRIRGPFVPLREICSEILVHARDIPVAILFGPEDRGLTNRELDPCQAFISIPTHPDLPSLNLAQSVMLVGYELRMSHLQSQENASAGGLLAKPAEFRTIEGMYGQMEELLLRIGFLDPQNPKRIMHTLRRIFGRANLCDRDVAILRGIFRQIDWYLAHGRKPSASPDPSPFPGRSR